jgi:hypothetical protein
MNGLSLFLCLHLAGVAQQPQLPPNYPRAQYDESRVRHDTLPELLVWLNRPGGRLARAHRTQGSAAGVDRDRRARLLGRSSILGWAFLAARAADPVYRLSLELESVVIEMPSGKTPWAT